MEEKIEGEVVAGKPKVSSLIKRKRGRPRIAQTIREKKSGQIVVTTKLDLFVDEFLRNGGNATEAALKVTGAKNRASAANMGSHYLQQAKALGRVYMEKKGYGYGKFLEVMLRNMESAKDPAWFDRAMKVAGYEDFLPSNKNSGGGNVAVNIFQTQKKMQDEFGFTEGEIISEGESKEDEKV